MYLMNLIMNLFMNPRTGGPIGAAAGWREGLTSRSEHLGHCRVASGGRKGSGEVGWGRGRQPGVPPMSEETLPGCAGGWSPGGRR